MNLARRSTLATLMGSLVLGVHAEVSQRTIVLVSGENLRNSVHGLWLTYLFTDAFSRLGLGFEYRAYPLKRAIQMEVRGEVDGGIFHGEAFGKEHPHLLPLTTSTFASTYSAFSARKLSLKNGWSALAGLNLRVNYRLGSLAAEAKLQSLVPARLLETVTDTATGLRKLRVGHSDIFVELDPLVESVMQQPEFAGMPLHKISTMESLDGFCYLHPKNADLVGPLSKVIAKMKASGQIEKYRKKAIREFKG